MDKSSASGSIGLSNVDDETSYNLSATDKMENANNVSDETGTQTQEEQNVEPLVTRIFDDSKLNDSLANMKSTFKQVEDLAFNKYSCCFAKMLIYIIGLLSTIDEIKEPIVTKEVNGEEVIDLDHYYQMFLETDVLSYFA